MVHYHRLETLRLVTGEFAKERQVYVSMRSRILASFFILQRRKHNMFIEKYLLRVRSLLNRKESFVESEWKDKALRRKSSIENAKNTNLKTTIYQIPIEK